jgi:acyl carrier protein
MRRYVRDRAAHILGLARPDHLNPERGFFDLGMDSLMAVNLKQRIENDFDCSLPRTVTFEYPTVASLSELLMARLAPPVVVRPSPVAPAKVKAARFAEAPVADLEQMLAGKLAAMREARK